MSPDSAIGGSSELLARFESGVLADFTIKCGAQEIKCHKRVLTQHSSVFADMLQSNFKEAVDDRVDIKDISYNVLLKTVRFLYGDQLEVKGADILDFTRLADKYDISSIRKVCETMLFENVNAKVVIYLWQYLLRYHSVTLADQCKKFSLKNFQDIMATSGFLDCDDKLLLTLLSDRHLKITREDRAVEAIINWVAHKQHDRAQHLQELFSKCIRTANVSSTAVHARLEMLGYNYCNETTKMAVMSLLRHASNVAAFDWESLPPRACTTYIDCLRLCLYSHDRISMCALFENDGGDLQDVHCQHRMGPASVHMSHVFDLGPPEQNTFVCASTGVTHVIYLSVIDWKKDIRLNFPIVNLVMLGDGGLLQIEQMESLRISIKKYPNIAALFSSHFRVKGLQVDQLPGQSVAVERYGNYVLIFSLGAGKLKFSTLDSIDFNWIGPYKVLEVDSGDLLCSTASDNIACLVCSDVVVLMMMDRIMRASLAKSGQMSKRSVRAKPRKLTTTVKSPVTSAGKQLSSATIYGQHLYIAETPLTNNQLKLHVTDFNQLVKLEDGATPVWSSKIVEISNSVRDHFGNFNDVKIKLSSKQMKNTLENA